MFIKSQDGTEYINLNRVDLIQINQTYNSVICKIDGTGHTIGNYKSKDEAQCVVDELLSRFYGLINIDEV